MAPGSTREVVLVRTGTANLASVGAALRRLGVVPRISEDPHVVGECDRLVLPGVGTLAAAMSRLEALSMVKPLRRRIERRAPTLAICLGMQMLCNGSEESAGIEGLGIIDARVTAFPPGVRAPQLGWNSVEAATGGHLLKSGYFYFANSYRLERPPQGWRVAMCDHGGEFVAALEDGGVLACQFHPELSGEAGSSLMRRWLGSTGGGEGC
jgi:imidazole glycerol-phosphate synthase subunit HisH